MAIELLPADAGHAEAWLSWREDPETKKYNPLAPATVKSLRERLEKSSSDLARFETADSFMWLIRSQGKIVGNVNLHGINRMMLTAEIGYTIAPDLRSKGFATAAVMLMTGRAFCETPLRKLIAYVHEGNIASRRVLEKLGYRHEGLLREHYLVNGQPANEAIYGILRSEFKNS